MRQKLTMAKGVSPSVLPLAFPTPEHMRWGGILQGFCPPFFPLLPLFLYVLLSSAAASSLPGVEYDYGTHPKFVCTPIPADADPSCFTPGDGLGNHGNGHNDGHSNGHNNGHSNGHNNGHSNGHNNGHSNGHNNGHSNGHSNSHNTGHHGPPIVRGLSDEAKTTILHLRESLVRQKETILDQRETIRELTAKLTLCESFGRGAGGHHEEEYHGSGHHGSYHSSSHHYDNDPHYPLNSHRSDPHKGKGPYLGKYGGFSPEQTGKTLQALKERLENLQSRNSSSTYSSSLRDLLQRKINLLEEQLHHHYDGHHDNGHHDNHHSDHHGDDHDDHHEDHHDNHHDSHDNHDDHHYDRHYGNRHNRQSNHHSDHHDSHDEHHNNNHDDHHENHDNEHPDEGHHSKEDHGHRPRASASKQGPRGTPHGGHAKLDTILSHLHRNTSPGVRKKPKSPDAFQIGFSMRSNYMYGRIKRTLLNEIFSLTVCLWLKGSSGQGLGTPFSYSVPGQANELVLIEWGNNPMELLVNDKAVTLPISVSDSKWHHLCITWATRDGVWEAYQDGVKRGSGENLSAWHPLKPGGVFILGQEQDTLGGRFDATQSFVGEISDLQFWSRVLTPHEIHNQATCTSHLTGDVITWTESVVELHGGVTKYPFDPCH
ncbi:neuronal pentraxin-1 [Denticeps clupeoides]|uniref:Pentraxin (PTX) domain-containing protein n=1 Tax=Denticeps clupeoides TaxID=299321 RepID=A0AAY4DUZ4_9TELE|nr:neuronal pentraxin-1-like [Denticeps clupeoides]